MEAARNLAQVVLQSPGTDDVRLRVAFRRVTARPPTNPEMVVLRGALRGQLETYHRDPKAAESLLRVGESPVDLHVPAPVLAAWTNVCTVIFNLDEAITRE